MTPLEHAAKMKREIAVVGLTVHEYSISIGKSSSWVHNRLALFRLLPELQAALEAGRLLMTNAILMARLPVDRQIDLREQALTVTCTKLKTLIYGPRKDNRLTNRTVSGFRRRRP